MTWVRIGNIRGPEGVPGTDGVAVNGVDGKDGRAGLDGPPGLVWRGPYVRGGRYLEDDAVEFEGSSYIATGPVRVKPPGGAWNLLAKKGKDGDAAGIVGGRGFPRGLASGLIVADEGTRLNGGTVLGEIDFAGAGVTTTQVGAKALVTIPGGGGPVTPPTLEDVLTAGNDGGALGIVNPGTIAGLPGDGAATGATLDVGNASVTSGGVFEAAGGVNDAGGTGASLELEPSNEDGEGGPVTLTGGNAGAGTDGDGGAVTIVAGDGDGAGSAGRVSIKTDNTTGDAGDVLTAQGDDSAIWAPAAGGLTMPQAMALGMGV